MSSMNVLIYNKRNLLVEISILESTKNGSSITKYNKKNGDVGFKYNPKGYLYIKNMTDNAYISFNIDEGFYELLEVFELIYRALIKEEELFLLDKSHLIINKKLIDDYMYTLVGYGGDITIKPSVVEKDNKEFEGISIVISDSSVLYLTHSELKVLIKKMNKLDLVNLSVSTMLLNKTMMREITSITYEGKSDNIYEEFKSTIEDSKKRMNRDILEKRNGGKSLWQ